MERPLAGLVNVRVAFIEGERSAATLQSETEFLHRHAGAEAQVIALDQRHHVAVRIGGRQIKGVAGANRGWVAVPRRREGSMGIKQRATRKRIFFGHELLHRHASEFGIGVEPRAILERELLRLDDEMQMLGAALAQLAEIEAFEDVQHL